MNRLHHVAIAVKEFDRYTDLFRSLGMTVQKCTGEAPDRQLWFHEGIQLKEVSEAENGNVVDHIALQTEDMHRTIEIALAYGCRQLPKGEKWFALPNGVTIELMS